MLKSALLSCKALLLLVAAQRSDPAIEDAVLNKDCLPREQIVDPSMGESAQSDDPSTIFLRLGNYLSITDDDEAARCDFDSTGGRIDHLPIEMVGNAPPNKTSGKP